MASTDTDLTHFSASFNTSERRNARDRLRRQQQKLANPGLIRRFRTFLRTFFFPTVGV